MSDIPLTGPIIPNPGSPAPSVYARYVQGSWINVLDHAERDILLTGVTTVGTLVRTLDDGIVWEVVSVAPVTYAVWEGSGGVTSFNGRTGAVFPAAGDYSASQVTNDSSVAGSFVKDALNALLGSIAGLVTGVSSVFGRAGAIVAAAGDYAASLITNDSASVPGAQVSNALDYLYAHSAWSTPRVLYVDPTISVETATVFQTIQHAINAVVPGGQFYRIVLPPSSFWAENLTIPANTFIHIGPNTLSEFETCTITGNITDSGGVLQKAITLSNIQFNGSITLTSAGAFSFIELKGSNVTGAITAPSFILDTGAPLPPQAQSSNYSTTIGPKLTISGAVNVGRITSSGTGYASAITAASAQMYDCLFTGVNLNVSQLLVMQRCVTRSGCTVTGAGTFYADAMTLKFIRQNSTTFTASLLKVLDDKTRIGPITATGGVAATNIFATALAGTYLIKFHIVIKVAGTAGKLIPNAIFTDDSGTVQTVPLTGPIDITAVGDSGSGTLLVQCNGSSPLQFNIAGAPGTFTAGPLSYVYRVTAEPDNYQ